MEYMGKILITIGIVLLILGAVILLGGKIGLGKLPGDIFVKKGNFTFFFPIVSSLIISLILTLILNLFKK
ncbi:DUF2905 domain-containing protein [Anaerosalibacter bizertensis]|nr:DUF2905 domain-containing protein [Anaerosalibacter bizertensis]MBV1817439.1 DUF2905 domain-containing protein [Bacteroidales bacterium MSK.15.36]HHV27773.1 DUF2905 domain-containing protein [Tissierellia bacterium]MBU5293407.1 DUF2905 domain-containing protein [Anaerosalibacter bizertensis]MCB5559261.1 DUF2905 domain-containing protein [Anaerosalibacter bizertensis]MCG4581829.1 DUF2905 domain-containing protein [Anaerosalibacter bizertensis]